ncbi:SAV_2336 N-terminal domain-related protein [Streptomyces sp. NPDC049555]|uniref:SAV_2336 N-terminal domain-related protein n=1 Tax=unclassified Streptomyces TaxID=2593676 RepID=UPI00343DD15B
MTAPPDGRLGQLIARLRAAPAPLDLSAQELADALWLARWIDHPGEPDGRAHGGGQDAAAHTAGRPAPAGHDRPPGPPPRPATGEPAPAPVRHAENTAPVAMYAAGGPGTAGTFPVRVPMAASLPGLLGLQRSLRPLRGYRTPTAPGPGPLDEDATADAAARTGIVQPVHRPGGRPSVALQLLMDTSASMAVWDRMLEELRQACAQLGVFRDVRVRYLHRAADGTPLVATRADSACHDGGGQVPRPAGQFRDPTGHLLTLVISDCVGPLWQEGRAQQLLRPWAQTAPLALVQPLPPRLWPRTALPAGAGLLTRDPTTGGRLHFRPDGYAPPPAPGALPLPVLLPTRDALGAWARLLSGPGRRAVRGAAGWLLPGHPPRPAPAPGTPGRADPGDLLRAFRVSASPGALRLAVHLAAVPLTLPVMQLVQRAMLPDTGPMELAEVLLSGLLWRLPDDVPGTGGGQWYEFADGVREMLLQSLDRGAAALVLKHCSDYVERHFGKAARNFPARAAALLSGEPAVTGPAPAQDAPDAPEPAEPELFAEVPARVVRWYQPVAADPGPLARAERLLGQWHLQGDPTLLQEARTAAESAAGAPLTAPDGARARRVLGSVLRALAGTGAVRRETAARRDLLQQAAELLDEAHRHTLPDDPGHLTAARELAATRHTLWRLDGDRAHLLAAARTLRTLPAGDPAGHLRLGRVLLDLARTAPGPAGPHAEEAATELRTACALMDDTPAPDGRRCAALLDLAAALRLADAPTAEILAALERAGEAAVGDGQLLRCRTEQARTHAAAEQWAAADEAYAAAVPIGPRDSTTRAELLTEWGESLLTRASGTGDAATVGRAEAVLREAYAVTPGRSPLLARTQLLLGRALVLRFGRQGFLPDLYESCHLLEQVARRAADGALRAEAWLELGTARLLQAERTGSVTVADAAAAFDAAVKEARRLPTPDGPGSLTVARALHRYGEAMERMGLRRPALAAYRGAQREWRDLTGRLAPVPWAQVQATREAVARLADDVAP